MSDTKIYGMPPIKLIGENSRRTAAVEAALELLRASYLGGNSHPVADARTIEDIADQIEAALKTD